MSGSEPAIHGSYRPSTWLTLSSHTTMEARCGCIPARNPHGVRFCRFCTEFYNGYIMWVDDAAPPFPPALINTMLQYGLADPSIANAPELLQEEQQPVPDTSNSWLNSWPMHWDAASGRPWRHCQAIEQSQREPPTGWALYRDPGSSRRYAVEEATGRGHFIT